MSRPPGHPDPPPPPPGGGRPGSYSSSERSQIRKWWHEVLRIYGKFSCYATFLVLTSDKEANRYLNEYGKELHLIADDNCLILAFSEFLEMKSGFDKRLWKVIISEHIDDGHSLKFAQHFDIDVARFPCLVLFDDIRSPNHILVPLKGMTAEEIAERMRLIFSVISKAVFAKKSPLHELKKQQNKEGRRQKGQAVFGELRSFTGKTIETAVEALINATLK